MLLSHKNILELDPLFRKIWQGSHVFDRIFRLNGEVYRQEANRKTLRFTINTKGYFVKLHYGVGWKEIFKNIFQLRWPVLGAQHEWRAILRLKELEIPTMKLMGYGLRGVNPAQLKSFVITEELGDTISLEDFCKNWQQQPPSLKLKRSLIAEVARIARLLHENGINHRDFYICHFLLRKQTIFDPRALQLFLIDLHRVQLRRSTPSRWLIKDLGGLFFSSLDIGLTNKDLFWFMKNYTRKPLATILKKDRFFWNKVIKCGKKLYTKVSGSR